MIQSHKKIHVTALQVFSLQTFQTMGVVTGKAPPALTVGSEADYTAKEIYFFHSGRVFHSAIGDPCIVLGAADGLLHVTASKVLALKLTMSVPEGVSFSTGDNIDIRHQGLIYMSGHCLHPDKRQAPVLVMNWGLGMYDIYSDLPTYIGALCDDVHGSPKVLYIVGEPVKAKALAS